MPDQPDAPDQATVTIRKGSAATDVPADQVQDYVNRGWAVEGGAQRAERVGTEARLTEEGTAAPIAAGLLRGATFGGSDALMRLTGGRDAGIALETAREDNPGLSLASELGGALITGGATAGRLGAAVKEGLGGGLVGSIGGGATEGAAYGFGNAVSELATSDDPLTAEHVASALSSNVLLGAGIGGGIGAGTKLLDRGLQLAGDKLQGATAAREALSSLPQDLAGLDEAGLKESYAAAKVEHAADIKAERQSLESIRGNQRAEMANRVRDLHEDLATERPIFSALSESEGITPELKGIDGVADARVQLAKSYRSVRSALDSPLSVERDPYPLIRPLEQRQAALETLQQRLPEMQAALAGDARAAVLEHVDGALADTKDQIAQIRALKETPVSGARLTTLEAGPSARMQAIDAAREALKNAPELGLAGKGASAAAFAGVTAMAHAIPGVGIAAPFVGKAASEAVERVFSRASGAVGKVSEKASGAAQKFLSAAKDLEPYVSSTATKTLAGVRFGAGKADASEGDLAALYRARSSELYGQTMRQPDGTTVMRPEARAAMAAKLDPIRQVNPLLADQLETIQARKTAYLAMIAPKKPDAPALQIGPDTSRPSDMAIRAWARAVRAVEDPASVEERLARGIVTPEEAQAYRTVYPERFAALQREIFAAAPHLEKTLPMGKKVALSIFTGIPVTKAMEPNVLAVLQSTFDVEAGTAGGTQAPRPQANFGSMGSLKDTDKPTPAQERQT